ncbi:hypothetical protein, partial [Pararhizobium capsulatum]|uniref:hypothetical protein n=1 Tax=Pararhizobium capsulatum TaxID=34014 RepID=UPI0027D8EBA6
SPLADVGGLASRTSYERRFSRTDLPLFCLGPQKSCHSFGGNLVRLSCVATEFLSALLDCKGVNREQDIGILHMRIGQCQQGGAYQPIAGRFGAVRLNKVEKRNIGISHCRSLKQRLITLVVFFPKMTLPSLIGARFYLSQKRHTQVTSRLD